MFEDMLREMREKLDGIKIRDSDYADPEAKRYPILSQAHVLAVAKGINSRKDYDEAGKAAVIDRTKKIAKRKGYSLPKSWTGKKEAIDLGTMSDQMVADAIQATLLNDPDPDCDGDIDQKEDDYGYSCWCDGYPRVRHVFSDATPSYFVFQFGWDGEYYRRDYTIDGNAEAVFGDTAQEVRIVISFVDVTREMDTAEMFVDVRGKATGEAGKIIATEAARSVLPFFTETMASAHFAETSVDDKGMFHISGTAIDPGVNRSGTRIYSKETLAAALPLFQKAKMYMDHPTSIEHQMIPERSVSKLAGQIERAWTNTAGGIDYEAVVFHPVMREMLANMKATDSLDAIGTSINYHGTATPVQFEGATLDNIDAITKLNSLDFVTEAGAWGTVSNMESLGIPAEGADAVTLEELTKLVEGMTSTVGTLTTAVTGLAERQIQTENRTELRALLAASDLPAAAQDRLFAQYKDAKTLDGVEAEITEMKSFITSLTEGMVPKVAPKTKGDAERIVARRVEQIKVEGLGRTGEGADVDTTEMPTKESFKADFGTFIQGGADVAGKLWDVVG